MKVEICGKVQDVVITCDSIKVENGLFIITNPIFDNESSSGVVETWMPVGSVKLINIIEK
jgi:hypothetical protein